ncbi:Flp family type IVb pilin [Sediminibacillus massiliensis]|uniref:Flp family type IVb pilin n=1 Tax=Sediminibacillus massiliensis TaxID=1926277 RepID=UPI0009883B59|nr:Flp family type IVb pilin [Sediminibacillus massiliensis]
MVNKIKGLFIEEEGQGMTEYGLILGLIAVGVIGILVTLGGEIKGVFENLTGRIPGVGSTNGTD